MRKVVQKRQEQDWRWCSHSAARVGYISWLPSPEAWAELSHCSLEKLPNQSVPVALKLRRSAR